MSPLEQQGGFEKREAQEPSVESAEDKISKLTDKGNKRAESIKAVGLDVPERLERPDERREAQKLLADALGLKEQMEADEDPEKRIEQANRMMAQFPVELLKNINMERKPGEGSYEEAFADFAQKPHTDEEILNA